MKRSQLKTGVLLSYGQMLISNIISIIYTPIMLRILGQNEYGLMSLTSSVISYLGLLQFGIGSSYNYFFYKTKAEKGDQEVEKLNGMFMTVYLLIGLIAFLAGMLLVLNVEWVFSTGLTDAEISKARILLLLGVVSLAFSLSTSVFGAYLNANEKFIFPRTVSLISTVLGPMVRLPLLFMGYRSIALSVVSLIFTLVGTAITIYYTVFRQRMKFKFSKFQFNLLKNMYTFSFFIFLNQIVDQINWSIDRYIISRFYGTASVAVYSIGASINTYYVTISSTISSVFSPRINKMTSEGNNNEELTSLMLRVGRIQFMLMTMILTGFIFFGYYFIVGYYAGDGYELSYWVVLLLIVPVTVPLVQNTGIEIQRAKNKHQFRSIAYTIMAFLNLGISIPLCKFFGVIGSAAGTSLGIVFANIIIMNWYYHTRLGLDMIRFWKGIMKLLPAEVIPVIVGFTFWKFIGITSPTRFICLGLCYVIVFVGSMWFFGMNESEKELFAGPIRRMLHKL